MNDFIIVGGGLAGIAFAEMARRNEKSFVLYDDNSQGSSMVAGGLYNPVILKRLSPAWYAEKGMDAIPAFYRPIAKLLGTNFDFPLPVLRRFASIEEQNNWFAAGDKSILSRFLSMKLVTTPIEGIEAGFGYGEVLETGYVDTAGLVRAYRGYLANNGNLVNESFDASTLRPSGDSVRYKDVAARHVIFADGFGLKRNPYFSWLPLDGTKGELLIIDAPGLKLENAIIKANVFLVPLGNGRFKAGATYAPWDSTAAPTENGKAELIHALKTLLDCDFEVVDHLAGIRPTVKDRRPLIGTHPKQPKVHLLNGLGSRGVMLAPVMADMLFRNIESGTPIDAECDLKRFEKKFFV